MNNWLIPLLLVALNLFSPAPGFSREEPEEPAKKSLESDLYRKFIDASLVQQRVLNYQNAKFGFGSVETLKSTEDLARMYYEIGNYNESAVLYKNAADIRKNKMPPTDENSEQIGVAYFMAGETYLVFGKYWLAEDYYDQSLNYFTRPESKGEAYNRKAMMFQKIGSNKKALQYHLESVKYYKQAAPSQEIDKRLLDAYEAIAQLFQGMEQWDQVKEYEGLIRELNKEVPGDEDPR